MGQGVLCCIQGNFNKTGLKVNLSLSPSQAHTSGCVGVLKGDYEQDVKLIDNVHANVRMYTINQTGATAKL